MFNYAKNLSIIFEKWRDNELNRADAALWSRSVAPGESLVLPGHSLDYLVLFQAPPR